MITSGLTEPIATFSEQTMIKKKEGVNHVWVSKTNSQEMGTKFSLH